ncbi:MAG: hypothetical protein U0805_21680 [Pirellulales bacterium]
MNPIQFETELQGEPALILPPEVLAQLPKSGRAKVLVLVEGESNDSEWRRASYEQFMRDDSPEDDVYDAYL